MFAVDVRLLVLKVLGRNSSRVHRRKVGGRLLAKLCGR